MITGGLHRRLDVARGDGHRIEAAEVDRLVLRLVPVHAHGVAGRGRLAERKFLCISLNLLLGEVGKTYLTLPKGKWEAAFTKNKFGSIQE